MADAINTGNPVSTTKFIINKYEDIQGGRVNQETPRGSLAFLDTNGRFTLPRTVAEAEKTVWIVDWPKPLNPAPYFEGPGLNGAPPYAMNDGSLYEQENDFSLDPDQLYSTPWPVGFTVYDIPPMLYGLPVTSGNKCLAFDGGTFTIGSGQFVGSVAQYTVGAPVYADYETGNEGKLTYTAPSGITGSVGRVFQKGVFGADTVTVILKGTDAL